MEFDQDVKEHEQHTEESQESQVSEERAKPIEQIAKQTYKLTDEEREELKLRIGKYVHGLSKMPFELDSILNDGLIFSRTLVVQTLSHLITQAACMELSAQLLFDTLEQDFETGKLEVVTLPSKTTTRARLRAVKLEANGGELDISKQDTARTETIE